MEDFSVTVTGDEIPEESILLQRLQEALKQGTTRVNIINGYVVDTDSSVRLSVGPVLGEITATTAIMMIEVTGKTDLIPITAKLYREHEKGEPIDMIEKEAHANRPIVFLFEGLDADTEYTGKKHSCLNITSRKSSLIYHGVTNIP